MKLNNIAKKIIMILLFSFIAFLYIGISLHKYDMSYEKCIENLSIEICARHEKELAKFSAWQPSVKCISYESTNYLTINLYYTVEELIYIFNESEIQKCWDYSKE